MLNQDRLKTKIFQALENQSPNNQDKSDDNENLKAQRLSFAEELAQAIIAEIKELQITYQKGLTSPSGPVAGNFTYQLN